MRRGSGVKGAGRVRRLLKRLPIDLRNELARDMKGAAPAILGAARRETPRRSGRLASLLSTKFYDKTLRLRVGLIGKAANRAGWYGRILEAGRKPQRVNVKRRTSNGVISYAMNVKAMPASRFDIVRGRTRTLALRLLRPLLSRAYDRALRKAASGSGTYD